MKLPSEFLLSVLLAFAANNASAITRYVDVNSTNPVPPYTNWATAVNVIQDAVDASIAGDTVMVANGVYTTGGKAVYGTLTNRVAVDKPLTLLSVNGPEVTIIEGSQQVVYDGFILRYPKRCAYLTNGAVLSGFTLTNGSTYFNGSNMKDQSGGGVWCEDIEATAFNCVITANSAYLAGGGVYRGTLYGCTIISNRLDDLSGGGGGTYGSVLNGCTLIGNSALAGGGAAKAVLSYCIVAKNRARVLGGGTANSDLDHCLIIDNLSETGGGSFSGSLTSCTMLGNSGTIYCGGAIGSVLNNCITYFNAAPVGSNHLDSTVNYSCTTPLPTNGIGNITNVPLFVDTNGWADLRLQLNSPCINAGNNAYVTSTNDLDGNPRIVGGTVDMGAYEFQSPQSVLSYAWLQQYGLPTDGSADFAHSDADPHNNWQEWKAWTDPTDELSYLRMLNPEPGTNGTQVSWESVAGQNYFLERSTNPVGPFSPVQSNITGQGGTTSVADTNVGGEGTFLYRVGVPE